MSSNQDSSQDHKSLVEQFTINTLFEQMKDNVEMHKQLMTKSFNNFTQVLKFNEANPNIPKEVLHEYKLKTAAILQPQRPVEEDSKTAIRQQTSHTTLEAVVQTTHASAKNSMETQTKPPIDTQTKFPMETQSKAPVEAQPNETDNPETENVAADQQQTASTSAMEEELDESAAQSLQNQSKRGKFTILRVTCFEGKCSEHFASMRELEQHLFTNHSILQFPCAQLECKYSFQTKAQLMVHKEVKHRRVTVWQCKICKRKFENTTKCADRFEGLIKHFKENHYLGEYKCIRCDTVSSSQAKANRHYDIKCTAKPTKTRTVQIYNPDLLQQQQPQQQPQQQLHSEQQSVQYTPQAMPNGMIVLVPSHMQSAVNLKISTATTVTDFFTEGPRKPSQSGQEQTGQNHQPQQFSTEMPSQSHSAESVAKSPATVNSIANSIKFVKRSSRLDNKPTQSSKN